GAPVGGEPDLADAELQPGGFHVLERGQGYLFDVIGQLACVAVDVRQVFGRDRNSEDGRANITQHRRGVSMRAGDGETRAVNLGALLQPTGNFLSQIIWDGEVIDGHEHDWAEGFVIYGQ